MSDEPEDPAWVRRGIERINDLESAMLIYRANVARAKAAYEEELEPMFQKRERNECSQDELLAAIEKADEKLDRRVAEEDAMMKRAAEDLTKGKTADDYLLPAN